MVQAHRHREIHHNISQAFSKDTYKKKPESDQIFQWKNWKFWEDGLLLKKKKNMLQKCMSDAKQTGYYMPIHLW